MTEGRRSQIPRLKIYNGRNNSYGIASGRNRLA
jgi:hypothetical protein